MRQGWRVRQLRPQERRNHPRPGKRRELDNQSQRPQQRRLPGLASHRMPKRRLVSRPWTPNHPCPNPPLRKRRPPGPPEIEDRPRPSIRRLRGNPAPPLLRLRKPAGCRRRSGRPPRRRSRKRPGPPMAGRSRRPCRCSGGNQRREPPAPQKTRRQVGRRILRLPTIARNRQRPPHRFPRKLRRPPKRTLAVRPTRKTNLG
jgi:hypothetical protein